MKVFGIALALLVSADADFGLRGVSEVEQFSCERSSQSQTQCDATKAEDGSSCVWCSVASLGACLSPQQADAMKQKIPGVSCDDDDNTDDDNSGNDDDPDADADDDSNGDDDEYWKCLKDSGKSEKTCSSAGCTWCDTKAGYGICMDKDAAEAASKSDWFQCKLELPTKPQLEREEGINLGRVDDPSDTSCIIATLQGDEESCKATLDRDGQACEWCSVASAQICLSSDQAAVAEQLGGDCSDNLDNQEEEGGKVDDPSDTSCIIATLQGDEESCEATLDRDGQACEWCSVASAQICLNSDQAALAEQLGGDCSDNLDNQEEEGGKVDDPSDTSCIIATLQGDEDSCKATLDGDGQACEWCSVASAQICLNSDQAALAEQLGGDCGDAVLSFS